MSLLPEVRGPAALDPQSLSVATGQGLAESPPELLVVGGQHSLHQLDQVQNMGNSFCYGNCPTQQGVPGSI